MKKIVSLLSLFCVLAGTAAGQGSRPDQQASFQEYLRDFDLCYQPPAGFLAESTQPRPFYLNAATRNLFHGTLFTLTACKEQEVLIHTYFQHVKPDAVLARMFPGFSPANNWINLLKAHADTVNSRIIYFSPEETRAYHADTAGIFDLVKQDTPYKGIYPKARAVFFNKAGLDGSHIDVVLYYFYKEGVDIDAYIRQTKRIFYFCTER
ncbi:hypothetical protein [Chitinophaga rhizosphaerae]|uniref:hypothetical protein n=1 Tax=Chitinophaga rhizosphaerae TaxID=1864947 RepID=UPI000F806C10|nr:hypothetical protein [Chitinophaga rhizosphaerae]